MRIIAVPRWLFGALIVASLGASEPEVVRIRVPSSRISQWFPTGSELQVLPVERFDAMIKAARDRSGPSTSARLLKATHSARWEAGRLVGRTELIVEPPDVGGAELVVLDPWSPALIDQGPGSKLLRGLPDGQLALKVEPGSRPTSAGFDWTLRARPGSNGLAFAIGVPDVELASITLDLPASLVPELSNTPRVASPPASSTGRSAWKFEAARGLLELRLREPSKDKGRPDPSSLWLEGSTTIDLGLSPINWRADWTIEGSPVGPGSSTIDFDPGLEVVDVLGPRVRSVRFLPAVAGSTAIVELNEEGVGPSPLTIRAICRVPDEGTWAVASARPRDATWLGGRTLVRLDRSRVLQGCADRSGRRVPSGSAELSFEPREGSGPVADLTFRRPSTEPNVEVRGLLRVGNDIPRVEVGLTWSVERGRVLSLAADLPPGWTPEGASTASGSPISWHAESLGSGGTRVFLASPVPDEPGRSISLVLVASARGAGATGPLELPRVRPALGARVLDEVWVAIPEPGLSMKPILGRGLAWLDPPDPPIDQVPTPWKLADLRKGCLAWRWVAEDAEARVDRSPPPQTPRGEVQLEATIRSGRLALQWTIDVESTSGDLDSIPILIDDPAESPISWKTGDPASATIEARPMELSRRAVLGFSTGGRAWELPIPGPARGQVRLTGRMERPWDGRGSLPLLHLPRRFQARGSVTLIVEDSTRLKADPTEMTAIASPPPDGDPSGSTMGTKIVPKLGLRKAAAFEYRSIASRLAVETTDASHAIEGGLIREAWLVSDLSVGSGSRHRLSLSIAADGPRTLDWVMPKGVAIDRLRRDGRDVTPVESGSGLRVEIPRPGSGRPLCSLTIEYRTPDDPLRGSIEPARLLPSFSMPCLGFVWEVIAPEPWSLDRVDPGLELSDPRPTPSIAARLLGFDSASWSDRFRGDRGPVDDGMIADLDKTAGDLGGGETSLGDWFLRLDAGRWPLILDRLALGSARWGPESRIDPAQAVSVRSVLEPMGLIALPLDGVMLITARGEVPSRPDEKAAWSTAIRSVLVEEFDPTDRFQSASRWRGEITPRSLGSGESADRPWSFGGRHPWRIVSHGWPAGGASVHLNDEQADRAWGWALTAVLLVSGILARTAPAKSRAIALMTIGMVATVGLAWRWPAPSMTCSGLLRGCVCVWAVWLGCSWRRPPSRIPTSPGEVSTTSRRGSFEGLAIPPLLGLSLWFVFAPAAVEGSNRAEDDAPILAILPFDGPADPNSRPDRVVLLLKDRDRLESLGRSEPRTPGVPVTLLATSHKVGRSGPGHAIVEESDEVEVSKAGLVTWIFPVGSAIELTATIDGRAASLAISPDGSSASLTFEGVGNHQLGLRRLVTLSRLGQGEERARVPIVKSAFARLAVSQGVDPSWVEVVGASGDFSVGTGGVQGILGPIDMLEVRWFAGPRTASAEIVGPVDATFLWDVRPLGDLIRMRMAHSDPDGCSTIRVAMEPGMMIRHHSVPNVVAIRLEGTPDRPEWVAQVDPRLPKDSPIELEFWRPAPPGVETRRWPRIDLPTASKFGGLIALRRPKDWSGRLATRGPVDPSSVLLFAKNWARLPEDGSILAGVVRVGRSESPEVATSPVLPRRSIRSKLLLDLAPGRINVSIESILTDRQGRSFDAEVVIPPDLRIVRVGGKGLVDWHKISRDRIKLQFDGSEDAERPIRIEGFLSIPADSTLSETRRFQSKIPRPHWVDAEAIPATMEIVSPVRFQLDVGEGALARSSNAPAPPDSPFQVDDPSSVIAIRWGAMPARVKVGVDSELAIEPGQLSWTALLTCDVSGGPAETLDWNLPTAWANSATLEVEGTTHQLVSQAIGPRGETTHWTIRPDSPIWGRARLILRARRPLRAGADFEFPQLAPLSTTGRGSVERYDLAILNSSGRAMEVAGSSEVQPIDPSRLQPLPSSNKRAIDRAYHVTGDRWSLRLRVGRPGEDAPSIREVGETRVAHAQLDSILGSNGETWGLARYDLETHPGPFLAIQLPKSASIRWTAVENEIAPAIEEGSGHWLVALGDRGPRRITLAWHDPARGSSVLVRDGLAWPTLDRPATVTWLSIASPAGCELKPTDRGFRRVDTSEWELEQLGRSARRIVAAVGHLDRSSTRDRSVILDELTEVELLTRRMTRKSNLTGSGSDPNVDRLETPLNAISEAIQSSGLDDLIQEARARVGLVAPSEESLEEVSVSAPEVVRLRPFHQPMYFKTTGETAGKAEIQLSIENSRDRASRSWQPWILCGLGCLGWAGIGIFVSREMRAIPRLAIPLLILLAVPMLIWQPIGWIAMSGLVGFGRFWR